MSTILVLIDYYLPGFKAGGPLRTLSNMVQRLSDDFTFLIMCRDRDLGDITSYPGIKVNSWQMREDCQVCYVSSAKMIYQNLKQSNFELLYLNSFFSRLYSVWPLLIHKFILKNKVPVIIAPRGEFSNGALGLKNLRKRLFIYFIKQLRLYKAVMWHASSDSEAQDIRRVFGEQAKIHIAPDLSFFSLRETEPNYRLRKIPKKLRIVFLSRISPMKNLMMALQIILSLEAEGEIQFDIYGPIEDIGYWDQCQLLIEKAPRHMKIKYHGVLQHNSVLEVLGQYDLFFLPTLGENFGHVILEALLSGCPVLVSDNVPWNDLAVKKAGANYSLKNPALFQSFLKIWLAMDDVTHQAYRQHAASYALAYINNQDIVYKNRQLFLEQISQKKIMDRSA